MTSDEQIFRIREAREALNAKPLPLRHLVNPARRYHRPPASQWYLSALGPATNTFGARILPGQSASAWPLVRGDGIGAATLGSSLGTSMPTVIYIAYVHPKFFKSQMEKLSPRWPGILASAQEVHELLGGSAAPFDYLQGILDHPDLPVEQEEEASVLPPILKALDPSEERAKVVDFVTAHLGSEVPLEPPEPLGAWEGYATCLAVHHRKYSRRWDQDVTDAQRRAAWRLLHEPAAFDTHPSRDVPSQSYHPAFLGNRHNVRNLLTAFHYLQTAPPALLDEWTDDPFFQHVVIPQAEDAEGPWHLGQMKAAAQYDGLDQPELAWNMLASGQYWQNVRGGEAPWLDAALSLARRREWPDVVAALEDTASMAAP